MSKHVTLNISDSLQARLLPVAEKAGMSVGDLAELVLTRHLDEQEGLLSEIVEDEERWQKYLATGEAVDLTTVRNRLQNLAAEAALKT